MPNTGFTINAHRVDPYKNFKFRVLWPPRRGENPVPVLGISKVGALKRVTEVVKHRSGGDNSHDHKSPGRTSFEGISMERGLTHDTAFLDWANTVHSDAGDAAMDLVNYKRDLVLEVMNEKGHVAFRYFLYECWVSEFTTTPDLDSNANAVAVETIKIEVESWNRDMERKEPNEANSV